MKSGSLYKREAYLALKERDGLICRLCGGSLVKEWEQYEEWRSKLNGVANMPIKIKRSKIELTIDHRMPKAQLRRNGVDHTLWNELTNLQLAHKSCNVKKGDSRLL